VDLTEVRRLGRELMDQHGLGEWALVLDRAKRRAGVCRYHQRTIGLSAPLMRLYDEAEVRETVLHEIAHALVGAHAGHGPAWRAVARRIGSSGERCISPQAPQVAGAWVGTCRSGHAVTMHRRPRRVRSCTVCHPRGFSPDHLIEEWRHHGEPAPMHPDYLRELAGIRDLRRGLRVRWERWVASYPGA
jgi:predicted SprT family Zn-dependent metalloprotease